MPFISKIQRQSDYGSFPSSHPIVIDNGGSYFRIGWAGENEPRVIFRNIIQRPRHKVTGETITVVGDHNPALLKYFDCTRSGPRSAFDGNVLYQFEIMEYILDFGFDRLGADQSQINHPVLITECACNPVQSRSKMAELLFESYGVPSVAFGVDAAFSYKYNQQFGMCSNDGLAICSGFNTSHVIPFLNGEPVYEACCRTNVGGYHITDYLKQLLSLKYPHHMSTLTWEKVEDLKMEHCYIAPDYASEVRLFQVHVVIKLLRVILKFSISIPLEKNYLRNKNQKIHFSLSLFSHLFRQHTFQKRTNHYYTISLQNSQFTHSHFKLPIIILLFSYHINFNRYIFILYPFTL